MAKRLKHTSPAGDPPAEPDSASHVEIARWLKTVRFRWALFGVSEQDVWKKIEELDALYAAALKAERVRYDALLEQRRQTPEGEDGRE